MKSLEWEGGQEGHKYTAWAHEIKQQYPLVFKETETPHFQPGYEETFVQNVTRFKIL